jgi:hypothetical protein
LSATVLGLSWEPNLLKVAAVIVATSCSSSTGENSSLLELTGLFYLSVILVFARSNECLIKLTWM